MSELLSRGRTVGIEETSSYTSDKIMELYTWLKLMVMVAIIGAVFSLASLYFMPNTIIISGKVVSANTDRPIDNVLVAVESSIPHSDESLGSYVRTDKDGKFFASAYNKSVSIKVWKPGYAMKGIGMEQVSINNEIVIRLREMTPTNWVSQHDEFYYIRPNDGFSFALSKVVKEDDPAADIVIKQDANDKTSAFIESRGDGGLVFQPFDEQRDFSNTPEAPLFGYRQSSAIKHSQTGLYFIRTRDGKHYAKLWLNISLVTQSDGFSYLDFDQGSRLIWAYQSDGTRNLEILPSENLPFPFYKFGLNGNSLQQSTRNH